ncbi:protein kinase domain-containing protein [Streptomyces sp. NPDC003011]
MGEVFAGRYELVDPIGRGGVGAVWRAWDHRRRRYVAAKVLQQRDAHALLRFVREQALRIDHPHVLAPASWAADDDKVLFTMDLVAGGSLVHLVGDYGPLPPPFVCTLLDQLLAGLSAVHAEGVVHRDVKPANILLEATGTGRPRLRLSDFGIAMRLGEPRLTETNLVVGTPGYIAPEQMLGAEPDFPADLFAVGLVALYLLEGSKPDAKALVQYFAAHGTPSAPKGIPEPLWQVVASMIQPDPQARFRTATGARKALASAVELLPAPGLDDEVIEIFDQLGPLPPGFGPQGPHHLASGVETGPGTSGRRAFGTVGEDRGGEEDRGGGTGTGGQTAGGQTAGESVRPTPGHPGSAAHAAPGAEAAFQGTGPGPHPAPSGPGAGSGTAYPGAGLAAGYPGTHPAATTFGADSQTGTSGAGPGAVPDTGQPGANPAPPHPGANHASRYPGTHPAAADPGWSQTSGPHPSDPGIRPGAGADAVPNAPHHRTGAPHHRTGPLPEPERNSAAPRPRGGPVPPADAPVQPQPPAPSVDPPIPAQPTTMSDTGSFHLPPPHSPASSPGTPPTPLPQPQHPYPQAHPQTQPPPQPQPHQRHPRHAAPVSPHDPTHVLPSPRPSAPPYPAQHSPASSHQRAEPSTASYTAEAPQVPSPAQAIARPRPRSGPSAKVALTILLLALTCYAVGIWALTRL